MDQVFILRGLVRLNVVRLKVVRLDVERDFLFWDPPPNRLDRSSDAQTARCCARALSQDKGFLDNWYPEGLCTLNPRPDRTI